MDRVKASPDHRLETLSWPAFLPPYTYHQEQEGAVAVFALTLFLLHSFTHLCACFRRHVSQWCSCEDQDNPWELFLSFYHVGPGNRTFTYWVFTPAPHLHSKESFLDRKRQCSEKHKIGCIQCFLSPELLLGPGKLCSANLSCFIKKGKYRATQESRARGSKGESGLWHCSGCCCLSNIGLRMSNGVTRDR